MAVATDGRTDHDQATDGGLPPVPVGVARRELAVLTHREVEVLRLLGAGLPDAGIAGELRLPEEAVGGHVSALLRKLRLPDREQAVALAGGCALAAPGTERHG